MIEPGNALIRRILQRGVVRGEFRALNLDYAIYSIIAPMIFVIMWKHSMAPCCGLGQGGLQAHIDPQAFIANQADILLRGLENTPPHPNSNALN